MSSALSFEHVFHERLPSLTLETVNHYIPNSGIKGMVWSGAGSQSADAGFLAPATWKLRENYAQLFF